MPTYNVHLSIFNCFGSVEHYYHFLFGFTLPLLMKMEELSNDPRVGKVFVRSCGPMDSLLVELSIPKLQLMHKEEHRLLGENIDCSNAPGFIKDRVGGFDNSAKYTYDKINVATAILLSRLGLGQLNRGDQVHSHSAIGKRIAIIDRGIDPFYQTVESEIRGGGKKRRSIPNIHELLDILKDHEQGVSLHTLERKSFKGNRPVNPSSQQDRNT